MLNKPLVSIITPAYNAERFIGETIESVLNQTYLNWEHLVVVDRNSKDSTLEIVRDYSKKDPRIKCITSEKAKGAAANRNLALEIAQGDFIACLDADDLWQNDKLEIQISFMIEHNYHFTYTSYNRISEDGKAIGIQQNIPEKTSYNSLLKNNCIACLTAIFKREGYGDIRFQEKGWEDMSYWLQILKRTPYAYGINKPLALYRIVNGSRSNNKFFASRLRWDTYRQVEGFSLPKSLYLFGIYIATSALKYARF